jgi:hypothetical protein
MEVLVEHLLLECFANMRFSYSRSTKSRSDAQLSRYDIGLL